MARAVARRTRVDCTSCATARGESVDLVAFSHAKRRRRRGDTVHGSTAVVDGRKPWLHVLRKAKRRLCQRVEPAKLFGREFDAERLEIVLELRESSRADNRRGHTRLRLNPGQRDARDRALMRLGDDLQLVHDRVGLLSEEGVSGEKFGPSITSC